MQKFQQLLCVRSLLRDARKRRSTEAWLRSSHPFDNPTNNCETFLRRGATNACEGPSEGPGGPAALLLPGRAVCVVAALGGGRAHTLLLFLISPRAAIGRQGRAIKKIKVTQ
jgi:hypothetical protein